MILKLFYVMFAKMGPGSFIFLRVYEVWERGIPEIAKHCFPNGFLGISEGPCGTLATSTLDSQAAARKSRVPQIFK